MGSFMPTYYDILKVQPTATTSEIQDAYDVAYNHWRGLVTHHDPNVATQANQALQALEQIRSVLTNPSARAQYDVKLNIETIGGLSDPSARKNLFTPVITPVAKKDQSVQSSAVNLQAWICPNSKCNTPNRIGTKFCVKCGIQVGMICPQCGSLVETVVEFCAECGINIKQCDRELKIKSQQERAELERKTEEAERHRVFREQMQLRKRVEKIGIEVAVCPKCKTMNSLALIRCEQCHASLDKVAPVHNPYL
jgi:curved DNA-binding protein CbpA